MDDPFPPSLPGYESPRIYDSNMTEAIEDMGADLNDQSYDSPLNLFGEPGFSNTAYQPAPLKDGDGTPSAPSHLLAPNWSNSPESSASSDSSNVHERKNSNQSSAMGDLTMADTPVANGILIGADPVDATVADDEASNNFMASTFDFESAASSPTPMLDLKGSREGKRTESIKMPVRSVPVTNSANSYTSKSSGSSVSTQL